MVFAPEVLQVPVEYKEGQQQDPKAENCQDQVQEKPAAPRAHQGRQGSKQGKKDGGPDPETALCFVQA